MLGRQKRWLAWWVFFPELVVLTVVFGISALAASQKEPAHLSYGVLFAASAGALGGTLGGAFQLRRTMLFEDIRAIQQTLLLQPVIGAASGLVVFLAYVQIHTQTGNYWIAGGLAGFAGGFSEPAFLKTVERLTVPGGGGAGQQRPTS